MMSLTDYALICAQSYRGGAEWHEVGDLAFAVLANSRTNSTIVAFRGTNSLRNWLRNATVLPKRTRKGYLAHGGFVEAFAELWPAVAARLPVNHGLVTFTGHSLGGALALLGAECVDGYAITFGCPRVYLRFVRSPHLYHTRVVMDDDPVPLIPRLGYRHLESALVLVDRDADIIDPEDHNISRYVAAAGKVCP